jgi:hypothetical protein
VSDAGYGGPHRSKAPAVPGDPLSGLEVGGHSHSKEGGYLSELMASCVATLLMIQTCTDRALPHSDVVLTLDSAIASLKPHAQVGRHGYQAGAVWKERLAGTTGGGWLLLSMLVCEDRATKAFPC